MKYTIETPAANNKGWRRVPDTSFDSREAAERYGLKYHTFKDGHRNFRVVEFSRDEKLDAALSRVDSITRSDAVTPRVGSVYEVGSVSAYHKARGLIEAVRVKEVIKNKYGEPSVIGQGLDLDEKTMKVVATSDGVVYSIRDLYRQITVK
jgi:hypothetical protein